MSGSARGTELDLAPCVLNVSSQTMQSLSSRSGRYFSVQTLVQGEPLVTRMPPLTRALLARIDCRSSLHEVLWDVQLQAGMATSSNEELTDEVQRQWLQLYRSLNDVGGFIFMSDLHLRSMPRHLLLALLQPTATAAETAL